jgi:hypothetical protein
MRKTLLVGALSALFGCGGGSTSIEVTFPSDGARKATSELTIYAFKREEAQASGVGQSCAEVLTDLAANEAIGVNPAGDPLQAPFDGKQITNFPAGDPIVLVVGTNIDKRPILAGCSERFGREDGTSDVPIALGVVVPRSASLIEIGGDKQAGRPGGDLPSPLRVRVDAVLPGAPRDVYQLPGLEITFTPMESDVLIAGAGRGAPLGVFTDENGIAEVRVTMPSDPGPRRIEASSRTVFDSCVALAVTQAEMRNCEAAAKVLFEISTVEPSSLRVGRQITTGLALTKVTEIAIGDIVGGTEVDVAVLGCQGEARGCAIGRAAERPLGQSRLSVVSDVLGSGNVVQPMTNDLGVAPSGLFVGAMIQGGGDDVAFVNSRRACFGTSCGEGSEVLVLEGRADGLALFGRYTLTASNAVRLRGYKNPESSVLVTGLVTAGQGKTGEQKRCNLGSPCLPDHKYTCIPDRPDCLTYCASTPGAPDCIDECVNDQSKCGCPAGERCECPSGETCPNVSAPGVCVRQDKEIDELINQSQNGGGFFNKNGCQQPVLACAKTGSGVPLSSCSCADNRGNACGGDDLCGCSVPSRIVIGGQAGVVASDLAIGRRRRALGPDVIAASLGGLEFIPFSNGNLQWQVRKTPTAPIEGVRVLRLDADEALDIFWFSRTACQDFRGQSEQCPDARAIEASMARGCAGVYLRDPEDMRADSIAPGGCRRHTLTITPDDACSGDFNGDGALDLALSSLGSPELQIFLGDGQGGLLDPPEPIVLPGGAGVGAIACGRIDGDDRDDIVGATASGDLVVVRSSP